MAVSAERREQMSRYNVSEAARRANRERAAARRATKHGGRVRAAQVVGKPARDVPAFDALPPRWKDPGLRISPEKIDACIERIFNDGPRLATSVAA